MKISSKTTLTVLIILLSFSLFMLFSKYDSMQKGVDQIFYTAINDSTSGLAKDYSKLSNDEKTRIYYQTINGLKTAQDTFYLTSYKEHEGVFQVINELYIYLLIYDTKKDDYEIEDRTYIYDTIWKMVWQPENEELVREFNKFIDDKKKILYNN